ncbi:MAG TPA: BON domain-containing protein [Gemmatimonadaceae bacterium]|nr:BON domain-containing protein [Gemmatimonadaceae bacterium]
MARGDRSQPSASQRSRSRPQPRSAAGSKSRSNRDIQGARRPRPDAIRESPAAPPLDRELPVPQPAGRWADTYGTGSGIEEEVERGRQPGYTRPANEERDRPPVQFRGSTGNPGGVEPAARSTRSGNFRGVGPRNYRRSDESLYEDVCEALTRNADVDATDIEVSVDQGEVTLRGTVSDRRAKRRAEDVADTVRGVRDIHNQLTVERGSSPAG